MTDDRQVHALPGELFPLQMDIFNSSCRSLLKYHSLGTASDENSLLTPM